MITGIDVLTPEKLNGDITRGDLAKSRTVRYRAAWPCAFEFLTPRVGQLCPDLLEGAGKKHLAEAENYHAPFPGSAAQIRGADVPKGDAMLSSNNESPAKWLPDLVLDGHDGVGKSTVAKAVAGSLNGSVLKPFSDSLGDHIAWLWRHQNYSDANRLCLQSIHRVLSTTRAPRPWVLDRHWVTMYTVLPEQFHEAWKPLPATVVLTATVDVMMARLTERGEDALDEDHHEHYRRLYVDLGRREDALILDTSGATVDETADRVLKYCSELGIDPRQDA